MSFRQYYKSIQRTMIRTVVQATVAVGIVEMTTHLPSQGRSSSWYHSISDEMIVPFLRQFCSPEQAHSIAVMASQYGFAPQSNVHRSSVEQRVTLSSQIVFGGHSKNYMNSSSNNIGSTTIVRTITNDDTDKDKDHYHHTDTTTNTTTGGIMPARKMTTSISRRVTNSSNLKNSSSLNSINSTVLTFTNPIGLAAGFDKDGCIISSMIQLGFGFVEIGTITPLPQPGNPKPRMFRLLQDQAIINRYGFNSKGYQQGLYNLQMFRSIQQQQGQQGEEVIVQQSEQLESNRLLTYINQFYQYIYSNSIQYQNKLLQQGLVGVNIGKNKNTSQDDAIIQEYIMGIQQLGPYADYLVINISSPNTEHLRDWQQPEHLSVLLQSCLQARDQFCIELQQQAQQQKGAQQGDTTLFHKKARYIPILVKLAPDLTDTELQIIGETCLSVGIDGIIACNTTKDRPADLISYRHRDEIGGLSGKPLKQKSLEMIRILYRATNGSIPIIGVGGIENGYDVYMKLRAGASLVQIYSSMIYAGPGLISRMKQELAQCMIDNGYHSVDEIIGLDHNDIYYINREQRQQQLQQQPQPHVQPVQPSLSSSLPILTP